MTSLAFSDATSAERASPGMETIESSATDADGECDVHPFVVEGPSKAQLAMEVIMTSYNPHKYEINAFYSPPGTPSCRGSIASGFGSSNSDMAIHSNPSMSPMLSSPEKRFPTYTEEQKSTLYSELDMAGAHIVHELPPWSPDDEYSGLQIIRAYYKICMYCEQSKPAGEFMPKSYICITCHTPDRMKR